MSLPWASVAGLCVFAAAACGGGDEGEAEAPAPVTVQLAAKNDSGQTAMAVLTDRGRSGTGVVVTVDPPNRFPGEIQNVTINEASCRKVLTFENYLERDEKTLGQVLTEVRDGRSETTAARSLSEFTSGGYSINVYYPAPPYPVAACGDVPER
jgi:hypothetical protein